eukprot:2262816-Amphidinium_carterae.1
MVEGLDPAMEVLRDKPFPVSGHASDLSAWQTYIDNLDMLELVGDEEVQSMVGTASEEFIKLGFLYALAGTPGSDDKD